MAVQADVEGVQQWKRGMRRLLADLDSTTRKTTKAGALLVERQAKQVLRTYTHRAGTPTPSPPGSPPALVTGFLARSMETRPARSVGLYTWAAESGPTAVYARIQELGGFIQNQHTPMWKRGVAGEGIYIPPRPYMQPTHGLVKGRIRDLYVKRWGEVIGGV